MRIVKLLQDYEASTGKFKAGDNLEYDGSMEDLQPLIDDGIAEIVDKETLRRQSKGIALRQMRDDGVLEELIDKGLDDKLAEINKNIKKKTPPANPPADKSDEYQKTAGYSHLGEFAQDVARASAKEGNISEKLFKWNQQAKATGMSEGVNADGGFLVPVEFRNQLMQDAIEVQVIRPRCTTIPMQTNSISIPAINASSHATSTFGGVTIYRPSEASQKTSSYPTFAKVTLTLHKLTGLCYATDELLEDSPITLQPLLTRMFSEAIGFTQDDDFINGTGANQALGILAAPATIDQAKETGQAATTIVYENIIKMKSRLKPRSWGNALWLAHQDTYPQLRSLSIAVGTGGSYLPLLTESSSGVQMLDGIPIRFSEKCQTLGTSGDIILGDWRQYLVGEKSGGVKVDTSIHLKFDYDETCFRFVLRYDGQPWETSALTPKHGSTTISSFVTLADRS